MSICFRRMCQWVSCQIRKIAGCACAGNAGNVSPRGRPQTNPQVSDPGMHHGTCVTHVPWCSRDSLSPVAGKTLPVFSAHAHPQFYVYLARGPCQGVSTPDMAVGGELVLLRSRGNRFAAGLRLMAQFASTWHLPMFACFHGTIEIICCYTIRSDRHPEGSQRPPAFSRDVCLTVSRNHKVFLLSSINKSKQQ